MFAFLLLLFTFVFVFLTSTAPIHRWLFLIEIINRRREFFGSMLLREFIWKHLTLTLFLHACSKVIFLLLCERLEIHWKGAHDFLFVLSYELPKKSSHYKPQKKKFFKIISK